MKPDQRPNCKLSINVNKIATLRNSRGGNVPDVVACAKDLIKFGAEGITVHPRPDERHIRISDVYALAALLKKTKLRRSSKKKIEFNIEGYPSSHYLDLIKRVKPDQATLVPDPPQALTSNAGWRLNQNERFLHKILETLRKFHVRSSLFVDPFTFSQREMAALARLKPDRIELYTERYAHDFKSRSHSSTIRVYQQTAVKAETIGVTVNAGHDLNSINLGTLLKSVPQIIEVSIGHAFIAESLYYGFRSTIQKYKREISLVVE